MQGILTSCALTSSRLDDFSSYLYTEMITIYLGGGAGHFFFFGGGGKLLPLNYPGQNVVL